MVKRSLFPFIKKIKKGNIMCFILILWTILLLHTNSYAQEANLQNLYINPEYQTKSEAIIFYNSINQCENCNKAIKMLLDILKEKYSDKLNIYLINVQNQPEFINTFQLTGPLNLVLIKISDHARFLHQKIQGLQSEVYDKYIFNRRISQFVNNFFGFY